MQSLLVDVNHIRNLATKNAFVTHETCRRSWKSLTLMSSEDDLQQDGFTEDSNLTPLLPEMLSCVGLPHSKTLSTPPLQQLLMPESSMMKMMLLRQLQRRRISTLHQVLLHHQTSTTTLLLRLLLMGTSRKLYVFKPFWSLLTKGGEAYELIVFKWVHMGGCNIFAKFLQLSF